MITEHIEKAKALTEEQYSDANEYGEYSDCIGFYFEGQYIINPWLDPSGRFPLLTEESIHLYGKDRFEEFYRTILRENSADKVSGWMSDGHPQNC